ncbi:MAG TPA: phosphomannomutase/phosphoglucomutase [Acidimicrobiia bacterium]|nr:phosphomannomutase/phosphoglucomutase [Acidimicrobiia bacterium]
MNLEAVFKAYDVRGIYPDQLDEELARLVGNAFAAFTGARAIVLGRDMRPSSEPLAAAFVEGANDAGCGIVDIGLASTDMLYFASGRHDLPGVMFTASHNPAQYNGMKFCRAGAAPVGEETGLAEIRARVESGVYEKSAERGRLEERPALAEFAEHVRSFIDVDALSPLTVIADTANGMGGLVVPEVFAGLAVNLTVLYPELDGTFPNHPADPLNLDNLKDLQAAVRDAGADVGLAFDGDADRVFLVDDQAEPVSGSTTTAMLAAGILDKQPADGRAGVVHNLICSKAVPEVIREHGGEPIRSRVGHSFIKQVMAETDAVFGGEHSAHYYFRDNWRADSGLIAAVLMLEQLSVSGLPLAEARRSFERYAQSGEINTEVASPLAVIERVAEHFAAVAAAESDRLDGLTVDLGEWWFNLRPSNTEPLLRLNLEAPDPAACEARTAEVLEIVRG